MTKQKVYDYNFQSDMIYGYNIKSVIIEDVKYYLINELLSDINTKTGSNYQMKSIMRLKNIHDFINALKKDDLRCGCDFNTYTVLEKKEGERNTFTVNVKGYILYLQYTQLTRGYIVSEEILNMILLYIDTNFAVAVSKYLKDQRAVNNNYLDSYLTQSSVKMIEDESNGRYIKNGDDEYVILKKIDNFQVEVSKFLKNTKKGKPTKSYKKFCRMIGEDKDLETLSEADKNIIYCKKVNGIGTEMKRQLLKYLQDRFGAKITGNKAFFTQPIQENEIILIRKNLKNFREKNFKLNIINE